MRDVQREKKVESTLGYITLRKYEIKRGSRKKPDRRTDRHTQRPPFLISYGMFHIQAYSSKHVVLLFLGFAQSFLTRICNLLNINFAGLFLFPSILLVNFYLQAFLFSLSLPFLLFLSISLVFFSHTQPQSCKHVLLLYLSLSLSLYIPHKLTLLSIHDCSLSSLYLSHLIA